MGSGVCTGSPPADLCLTRVRNLLGSLDAFIAVIQIYSVRIFLLTLGTGPQSHCCAVWCSCGSGFARRLWLGCDTGVWLSGVNAEGALGCQVTQSPCDFT